MRNWQFYRHMSVYLDNGRRLGRTEEIGHALDVLHVQQGRILVKDWYIPISAVRDVDAGGVRLAVNRRQLAANHWNVPPYSYLAKQGATPGYEYTSPRDGPEHGHAAGDAEGVQEGTHE